MRALILFAPLLAPLLIGGCATGYAADWFRSKPGIISPQLIRYGLDVPQARCVSEKLGEQLNVQRIRQFQERAAAVGRGVVPEPRLTIASLRTIAATMSDGDLRPVLDAALSGCNVSAPAPTLAATGEGITIPAGGIPANSPDARPDGAPGAPGAGAVAAPTLWLNLGAAAAGQSIAVDASSIQQEGTARTAWFRMTDPASGSPSTNSYRVRIDCSAKTVQPLAIRQHDAAGAPTSQRDYTPEESTPAPAEDGTVLEIAYLSLCT